MRRAKTIFRWLVGIAVGLYLAVLLLMNLPVVQRWMGSAAASILEDQLDTRVEVDRIVLGWNGRVTVDGLRLWDRQQEEMLNVARVGARISLREALNHRIRIGNAQLFGMHANLYQECEGCDPNFKFLIDAFASKDTTSHTPLDLRISQLIVRRSNIRWQQRWKLPSEEADSTKVRFNVSDLDIRNLNLTAQLNTLTDDSLNLRLRRLDFNEMHSQLNVNSLTFLVEANKQNARLAEFGLVLPHSNVQVPAIRVEGIDLPHRTIARYEGSLKAHLNPADLALLGPKITAIDNEADLRTEFWGDADAITFASLHLNDNKGQARLSASGRIENLRQGARQLQASADIWNLDIDEQLLHPYVHNEMLNRLGTLHAEGNIDWADQTASGRLNLRTALGNLVLNGRGHTDGKLDATVQSDGFQLGELLQNKDLGQVALDVKAKGQVSKRPDLSIQGRIAEVDYKGYRYRNIEVPQIKVRGKQMDFNLDSGDPNASLRAKGQVDLNQHTYNVVADIGSIVPHTLNLTPKYEGTQFSGQIVADFRGHDFNSLDGILHLNEFAMSDSTGTYRPGDLHLTARPSGEHQHMLLISPFLEAQIEGDIKPQVLVAQLQHMVSNYLPNKNGQKAHSLLQSDGQASFVVRAYSAEPLRRLLGIPLSLEGTLTAHGEMDSGKKALWLIAQAPGIHYGSEELKDVTLRLESNYESMLASAQMQRMMKGRWINVGFDTQGHDERLTTRVYFNNDTKTEEAGATSSYAGDISIVSRIWEDPEGHRGFEGEVLPSNLIISDTIWSVHPGFISYYNDVLRVDSFCISQGDRFVKVDGRASKLETDTLHAQLQRINLEYIFSLINFHAVELTGEATGDAYAHSLFSAPKADAYIRIPKFALNYGTMGNLDIHLNWGDRPYSIFLDGNIMDMANHGQTLVQGYITPKKDIDYHGLDLNVKAERVNLEFINKWTSSIFDNLQGRATGWVHIFGPFKQINIEGDALVNEASVGIPYIGVRYHIENDSVLLRPDNIYFTNARLYDPQGGPNVTGHSALVTGHLHHDSFKNLTYDILVRGDNILGYDFREFGDQNFYGTVYATGDVTLKGHPGQVRIGIKATPERGTTFTYNATSPDKLTETPFITYKKRDTAFLPLTEVQSPQAEEEEEEASDMFIDFDLDITPQSTMNLLMDARSGDKISLNGAGHMLAHFYNKGSFSLFGTYRVERGTYNLSLQEVIHKNFEFSPDGSISFNGEPYEADLNLQAIHTVSGVSLNDINPKANFSNTSARVNCLMNIGGKARAPRITFDFDILNANEDEKQMVRSLISTEEERNMQVIYLLGIGRFYAYDYNSETQTQGTLAMNSLLSSTLSGTINQALSNMIGSSHWNFGANLRTGEMGWSNMDVEGMLQGNLFNNRLLINGNFGYRDNPVATTNFIGDFDVKYLLTRSGSVALKAYSETNDRYFTKSSLTTQGIGIQLKKDFTSWRDIFTKTKR